MAWKATFDKGVACFRNGQLDEALAYMNQAAELQTNAFTIYDSRAAVHEKLGNLKAALLDSRRVIDLAPDRWQGYARSARLFDLHGKYSSSITMVDVALTRLRPEDVQRRTQLIELREKAVAARVAAKTARLSQVTRASYFLGKLPVETLVEIFTVLVDEDHTWAVRLSHVCGHWRRIIVNTPSAWQTLVLSDRLPLQKAKLWKQRAKNCITRIAISMLSVLDRDAVFSQLKDISWTNLSSLCVSGQVFVALHHMLSGMSLPHAFSTLEELTLLGSTSDQLSCCLSGPNWRLRTLRLSGLSDVNNEWWERIQQLKELHLTGPVGRFSVHMFTANPSLEKLVLDCRGAIVQVNPSDDDAVPVPMDNLKSVEVSSTHHILRAITVPSIRYFAMSTISDRANETLLHMGCHSSLVELHITNCSLSPCALPTLFSFTHNLETLRVNAVHGVVNELLQFLTPKTVDSLSCPALKHVDVSRCSDLTTSNLYAFVKTRVRCTSDSVGSAEKCAVIAALKVDGCPNIEPDMLPWFRSKVAQFSCVYATKKDFRKDRRRC